MAKSTDRELKNPSGFTLIELSFAVLFIALLLLTIALITTQIVGAYRKGVSLKAVNQVGREIIEDLRTSITNSPSTVKPDILCSGVSGYTNCVAEEAQKIFYNSRTYDGAIHTKEGNDDISNPQLYGVFCTGEYSYIWNNGYIFSSDYTASGVTLSGQGIKVNVNGYSGKPHFLRVKDTERSVCMNSIGITGQNNFTLDLTSTSVSDPTELISSSTVTDSGAKTDAPLALYDFYISTPPTHTSNGGRLFYTGSFILGTTSGGVNIKTANNNCKIPDGATQATSNFNYCAVNKFNFAAQSTNTK